jgi:hypothetical protein
MDQGIHLKFNIVGHLILICQCLFQDKVLRINIKPRHNNLWTVPDNILNLDHPILWINKDPTQTFQIWEVLQVRVILICSQEWECNQEDQWVLILILSIEITNNMYTLKFKRIHQLYLNKCIRIHKIAKHKDLLLNTIWLSIKIQTTTFLWNHNHRSWPNLLWFHQKN